MNFLEDWFNRKTSKQSGSISFVMEVDGKVQRIYGPRADFAQVSLLIEPADEFEYLCEAEWPDSEVDYNQAVVDGVLDGLVSVLPEVWYTNVKVTLQALKYHPVDSSYKAFYKAARNAIGKLEFEHKNERRVFSAPN